jgi:uncharacterized hydantoinase/oxoprolinase family protein
LIHHCGSSRLEGRGRGTVSRLQELMLRVVSAAGLLKLAMLMLVMVAELVDSLEIGEAGVVEIIIKYTEKGKRNIGTTSCNK